MSLERYIENNNREKRSIQTILRNIKENPGNSILDFYLLTNAQRETASSKGFVGEIELALRRVGIYQQGLAVFELTNKKAGEKTARQVTTDQYKQGFCYLWSLTPKGEQVLEDIEIGLKFGILYDFDLFCLEKSDTAVKVEEYIGESRINNSMLTKMLDANEFPEFDKARKLFIVEKLRRTNKNGVLVVDG